MALSTFLANELADHVFGNAAYTGPTAWYVQTHTADPTAAGTTAAYTAWTGTTTRAACSAWTITANVASNTNAVLFEGCNADSTAISHISIWDAQTGGNCLAYGPLGTPKTCDTGDNLNFAATEIDVTFVTTADA